MVSFFECKYVIASQTFFNELNKVIISLPWPDGAMKPAFPYMGENRELAQ